MPTLPQERPATPRYLQMAQQIEEQIQTGDLQPGVRLPSYGRMRKQFGTNTATVDRIYVELERKGLIRREAKRGVFVADPKRRQALGVIGVVSSYLGKRHPYYAALLKGIQDTAHQNRLEVLLMHEASAIKLEKVDGVLIEGMDETFLRQLPPGMPCVTMLTDSPEMPKVTTDDEQGIRDAMAYLLNQGHRRIGYLLAYSSSELSRKRYAAYFECLRSANIRFEQGWAKDLESWMTDGFRDLGRRKMNEWLQEGWASLGCTAVLAQNDDTAIGIIEALQGAGYRVPQDVSVIGFDGVEPPDYFGPRLTTIQIPLESISRCSVDLLTKIVDRQHHGLEMEHRNKESIVLPTRLRIGDSTGPPPQ